MTGPDPRAPVLVSACLLGRLCRYDGRDSLDPKLAPLIENREVVPVCPEELGGLGTPREPAEIEGGAGAEVLDGAARVVDRTGRDVTAAYLEGGRAALEEARRSGARLAYLKARSPSCGFGRVASQGSTVAGNGVFAEMLRRAGVEVVACEGRPSGSAGESA